MPLNRLYLRLYLAFLGVLVAVAVVSALIAALFGRNLPLVRQGPRIAAHLSRLLPSAADRGALDAALDEAHDELGLDLVVVDADGNRVAEAGQRIELPDADELDHVLRAPGWVGTTLVGAPLWPSGPTHHLHPPLGPMGPFGPMFDEARGRAPAAVLVAMPPQGRLQRWPVRFLAVLLGTLLVTGALLYPLSRSITRPLEQLTAAAVRFGRGDLTARSGIDAQDEVGRLASTFDEMAGRIEAARRTEKELLANVSHELRTPLARLKVALELIEPPPGPAGDALRKRIAGLGEEVDELSNLVSDVLTASRLDLAQLPVRRAPLDVPELLATARDRAHALSAEPVVTLDAPAGLSLHADEALLARALDNLLDNARKYGQGPVELTARAEGGNVLLRVRDHGSGFEPDDLARVFEPFFRGGAARGAQSGYGLGLALARRVAEAHGGTIRAANADDGGAVLELSLPA